MKVYILSKLTNIIEFFILFLLFFFLQMLDGRSKLQHNTANSCRGYSSFQHHLSLQYFACPLREIA